AEANHLVVVGNEDAGHRRPLRAHSSLSSEVQSNHRVTLLRNLQRIRIMESPETLRGKPGEFTPGGSTAAEAARASRVGADPHQDRHARSRPRTQHHCPAVAIWVFPAAYQSGQARSTNLLFRLPPAAANGGTRSRFAA